jgi:hypothetical protein
MQFQPLMTCIIKYDSLVLPLIPSGIILYNKYRHFLFHRDTSEDQRTTAGTPRGHSCDTDTELCSCFVRKLQIDASMDKQYKVLSWRLSYLGQVAGGTEKRMNIP